jgi:glycosyltransferase involved in cell wall biosynthesis
VRILYFTRDFSPHDYRFLTSLAESGQEVFFLRLERRERALDDRALPPQVTQVRWRGGQAPFHWRDVPALLRSLRGVLRQVRPDVLHAGPIQSAAFLGALSGFRPLVSMSWGSDLLQDAGKNRWYGWITRYTLCRSTVLAGDCAAVREKAAAYGFPRERIFIFPWGIDLERFAPAGSSSAAGPDAPGADPASGWDYRARLGWQNCFVALSLRSWEPVYGIDVLLDGFTRAARQDPDLRLLLLGGGSQAGLVHQVIQGSGLGDRIHLAGQISQNDLPRLYQSADLYLSASRSDGSSVSLMEALASGLPALVSDIPGNKEWIENGRQGWLFTDGDAAALAARLLAAAQDRAALPQMGRAARCLAEERADWKKNYPVLLQAYAAAARLAGAAPPREGRA